MSYNLDSSKGLSEIFGLNSPSKIMKVDQRIALKHFNMYEYVYAHVVNIEKNFVRVRFSSSFQAVDLFPEDPVGIIFSFNDKIYIGSGEIVTVEEIDPLTIEFKVEKIEKRNSLRKNERFFVSVACDINIKSIDKTVFGIAKNLSYTGIKINSKEDINEQERLLITLKLDKYMQLACFGKIVRKQKLGRYNEYGVQIENLTQNNMLKLQHYINTLNSID